MSSRFETIDPRLAAPVSEIYVVPDERAGIELDEFLCLTLPQLSKGFIRRQVNSGKVLVDGQPAHHASQRLRREQVVIVEIDEEEWPGAPVAPRLTLPILYEDPEVLVVDKPSGLAVEPERWLRENATIAGALLEIAIERAGGRDEHGRPAEGALEFRPRIVHRLDKETSGALLVAKTLEAERQLRQAFEHGLVRKRYLALVEGEFPTEPPERLIDLPVAPDPRKSGRMCVDEREGKPSQTRVGVVERFRGYTLLCCEPLTGRTHQIRVHLSELGFPLAVDPVYGRRRALLLSEIKRDFRPKAGRTETALIARLTLHAARLDFPRISRERVALPPDALRVCVDAPLPKDFMLALRQLGKVRPARA